jgi:hypothetical protein
MKLATNNQKKKLKMGRNLGLLMGDRSIKGMTNKTRIAPNIARTPPNLFGIALKIA